MDPTDDSIGSPAVNGEADAAPGDSILSEIPPSLQHVDTLSKKMEKSKRQSKHAYMGPDTDNANLKRRTSKMGLFGLFNRSKIALDIDTPQERLETQWEGIVSTERPVTRDPGAAYIPLEADLMPIQECQDLLTDPKLRNQASKGKLRNRHSFKRESKRESKEPVPLPIPPSTWSAPPLFQVYPQSIKYSTLKAPLMSAEAILRLSKEMNTANESSGGVHGDRSSSIDGKPQKEKKLKKPTALETMAKGEWVDKTYVLVTAGYLLQYAGQGTYDRVPEKILQLTDVSAAFATDAIPGKPFVLQISQALNEDGTVDTEMSRSMFKKMGGLRADMRRAVSNLLLVLESPEEMNEWLVAVRKEIEALGGKEHNPEMPWDEPEDKARDFPEAERMPSQRYLVQRNPKQFSPKPWEPPYDVNLDDKIVQEEKSQDPIRSPTQSVGNRQSMATQNSLNSRYVSDTHASIDQVHLDRLRESFASTAERTTSTSRDSSPNRSPLLDQDFISEVRAKPLAKASTYPDTVRITRQRLSESTGMDRESLQPTPTPQSRPDSAAVSSNSGPSERTRSPEHRMSPPPNFSVPSFSKRYSTASTSPVPSAKAQSPPPITVLQGSSVSEDEEKNIIAEEGASTIGKLQTSYKSSPRASVRLSSPQPSSSHLNTPPTSSHSFVTPPGSSDGERPYSRRFSSLDYARGISPVKPTQHSPSPHPPPSAPLPPLPNSANSSKRTSFIPPATAPPNVPLPPLPVARPSSQTPPAPPPTCPLPPVPNEGRTSSGASKSSEMKERSATPSWSAAPSPASSISPFPPPATGLPPVPTGARPTTPSEKRQSNSGKPQSKRDSSTTRLTKPRPKSSQAHDISETTPPLPQTAFVSTFTIEHQAASKPPGPITPAPSAPSIASPVASSSLVLSSSLCQSPPKPTRAAPPPPPPPAPITDTSPQTSSPMESDAFVQQPPPRATDTPLQAFPSRVVDKSIRAPPPPVPDSTSASKLSTRPPSPPVVNSRKKLLRKGREPPPVFSPRIYSKTKIPTVPSPSVVEPPKTEVPPVPFPATDEKSKSKISVISPSEPYKEQQAASPHPFIPPIKLSHSREKGSFDGPWNAEYDQGPKATFLGLGAA